MNILGFPTEIKAWLQGLAGDDLRTPHGEIMWLIREEAMRRGLKGTMCELPHGMTLSACQELGPLPDKWRGRFKNGFGELAIKDPPCQHCRYWLEHPGKDLTEIMRCNTDGDMERNFGCFRPKDCEQ